MGKHAYLIAAHSNFYLLQNLISVLDDERNDIYVHIDKKSKEFDKSKITSKHSKLYFINRINIVWGGYSQIQLTINLLKSATQNQYEYYHFLSGQDLLLKSQDYIHNFFEDNKGKEFIHFSTTEFNKEFSERYKVYHPFQDIVGRNKKSILFYIEKVFVEFQKILKVDRTKSLAIKFCGGCNWFSITHNLAKYILNNETTIKKLFKYTKCCDEFFLQTIVYNSKFYKNVYHKEFKSEYISCMRYIDWKRGNPYTFRINDYDELLNSGYLFARKFGASTNEEKELIDKILKVKC